MTKKTPFEKLETALADAFAATDATTITSVVGGRMYRVVPVG